MSLKANALITVEELKSFLELNSGAIQAPLLTIYNSSGDASAATVQVTATTIVLTVTGGANAGTSTLTLADADKDTLTELITAITALNKGWVVTMQGISGAVSADLTVIPATACFEAAHTVTLYGANNYRLETYINAVSDFIERETNRNFKSATYTNEFQDGTGHKDLWLNNWPIISITSIAYYDRYSSADLYVLTLDTDFYLYANTGRLENADIWPCGSRNVKVTYVAGYAEIPDDLKLLCMQLVDFQMTKKRKNVSQSGSGQTYTSIILKDALPADLQMQINNFKRIIF